MNSCENATVAFKSDFDDAVQTVCAQRADAAACISTISSAMQAQQSLADPKTQAALKSDLRIVYSHVEDGDLVIDALQNKLTLRDINGC